MSNQVCCGTSNPPRAGGAACVFFKRGFRHSSHGVNQEMSGLGLNQDLVACVYQTEKKNYKSRKRRRKSAAISESLKWLGAGVREKNERGRRENAKRASGWNHLPASPTPKDSMQRGSRAWRPFPARPRCPDKSTCPWAARTCGPRCTLPRGLPPRTRRTRRRWRSPGPPRHH
jgi:hypothetical protein